MSGLFCRQFSIAVWPLAWSPAVSRLHTTCGSVACWVAFGLMPETPKPDRNPLCRNTPTVTPGARSSVAIFAGLPANDALAYLPISSPAVKLLVANSASTALCGSVGVSSAMTSTFFARAFWIAGTIALVSLGVIMMPLTPAATMFSIAVTWLALSPSNLPAADIRVAPLAFASLSAPSFILTKNGLVSVFVIRPSLTSPELPPDDELLLDLPQAATASTAARAVASRAAALR